VNLPKTFDPTKIPIRASTQEHLDIEDIQDGIVILRDGSCCLVIATTAINFGLLSEKEQEATIYAYAGLLNSLTFSIQVVLRSQRKDISGYVELVKRAEEKETKKEIKIQIQKYRQFIKEDHVLRQVARLGLKAKQLNTQELIQLFFNVYNPEVKGQQLTTTEQYQRPMVEPAMAKVKEGVPPSQPLPSPISETEIPKIEPEKPVQPLGEIEVETKPVKEESIQNQINGLIKKAVGR